MDTILRIMSDLYDAGMGVFDPTSILWSAEHAADEIGVEATKAGLTAINRKRERLGLPAAVFEFGHRLF